MALRLRKVEALAAELNKDVQDVINILTNKGVRVIDGLYDQALFDAILKEPALRGKQRLEWGLSHRLGIGAVKHLLDPMGLRITIHDCKGAQYLMLKKGLTHNYIKWQYSNSVGRRIRACTFSVRGFTAESKFDHYLLTCFEGPFAWAISRKHLIAAHNTVKSGQELEGFRIPNSLKDHPTGALILRLSLDSSKYEFKNIKQLGF